MVGGNSLVDGALEMRSLSDGQNPIGRNPLWTAEVVGMYFAKRRQNITLYKGNNTGDDVSQELTSHYSGINDVGLVAFCPHWELLRHLAVDYHRNELLTISHTLYQ